MTADRTLGREGEKVAQDYLVKNNFSILNTNWRSGRYGEIDIVAFDNSKKELVFIEVKSRTTSTDDAKELVTKNKQKQLYKLANSYLSQESKEGIACRFDVIAIKISEHERKIEHIKDAFYIN